MKRIAQIYLIIVTAVICLWQLPWIYNFFTVEAYTTPFILYSSVVDDFVVRKTENKKIVCSGLDGTTYTINQYDSILPEYQARQLAAYDCLPDTLFGRAVSLKMLTEEAISMRIKPEMVFGPQIPLYQLMESQSGRVDFEMPDDVFRITDSKIEFVIKDSNKVNEPKSQKFTEALSDAGFVFPAVEIAGNPTSKKRYDNGYLITDSRNCLFNLKMEKGNPNVQQIEFDQQIVPCHIFVTEFTGMHSLGMFFDQNGKLYVITMPEKEIKMVDIPPVDLHADEVFIMGNIFTWTIRIKNDDTVSWYAVDAQNFAQKKSYSQPVGYEYVKGLDFEENGWIVPGWR